MFSRFSLLLCSLVFRIVQFQYCEVYVYVKSRHVHFDSDFCWSPRILLWNIQWVVESKQILNYQEKVWLKVEMIVVLHKHIIHLTAQWIRSSSRPGNWLADAALLWKYWELFSTCICVKCRGPKYNLYNVCNGLVVRNTRETNGLSNHNCNVHIYIVLGSHFKNLPRTLDHITNHHLPFEQGAWSKSNLIVFTILMRKG